MPSDSNFHEDLSSRTPVNGSSNRSFGLVFTVVFAVIALAPLRHGEAVRLWALGLSAAFLIAALFAAHFLEPLNRIWTRFGLLLHRIVNPAVMGLLFFLTITPMGLIMRGLGKDPLRLRFNRNARSYWIERRPPGPPPQSMRQQF